MPENNTNEICHYGVLGMKWGKRKARAISERRAKRYEKIKERNEKMVADNDRRVDKYGKTGVKIADAARIATTAIGMKVGMDLVKSIGKSSIKVIADNPNMGKAAVNTASILTVGGMGAIAVSSIKKMNTLSKDMKLADQREYRKYINNQIEVKKK